jgi:hypothetical protein
MIGRDTCLLCCQVRSIKRARLASPIMDSSVWECDVCDSFNVEHKFACEFCGEVQEIYKIAAESQNVFPSCAKGSGNTNVVASDGMEGDLKLLVMQVREITGDSFSVPRIERVLVREHFNVQSTVDILFGGNEEEDEEDSSYSPPPLSSRLGHVTHSIVKQTKFEAQTRNITHNDIRVSSGFSSAAAPVVNEEASSNTSSRRTLLSKLINQEALGSVIDCAGIEKGSNSTTYSINNVKSKSILPEVYSQHSSSYGVSRQSSKESGPSYNRKVYVTSDDEEEYNQIEAEQEADDDDIDYIPDLRKPSKSIPKESIKSTTTSIAQSKLEEWVFVPFFKSFQLYIIYNHFINSN